MLEGGEDTGSGAADRSENYLKADNLIIACCNHDTLVHLQEEGEGAFLSRIEDKGEIVQMESAVPETAESVKQVAQYIKQEILNLEQEFERTWGKVFEKEGKCFEGVLGNFGNFVGKFFGKILEKFLRKSFTKKFLRKNSNKNSYKIL